VDSVEVTTRIMTVSAATKQFMRHKQKCLSCRLRARCTPSPKVSLLPCKTHEVQYDAVAGGMTGRWYLFDVRYLGSKALRNLGDDFLDQRLILHRFACLHYAEGEFI
jgi:hypothetical protein